jgi:hypothetical protein
LIKTVKTSRHNIGPWTHFYWTSSCRSSRICRKDHNLLTVILDC